MVYSQTYRIAVSNSERKVNMILTHRIEEALQVGSISEDVEAVRFASAR